MTLDLILLGIVLIFGFWGWVKGFADQFIHAIGLASAVMLASPVAHVLAPEAHQHLDTLPQALLRELLWWGSAVVSYISVIAICKFLTKLGIKGLRTAKRPGPDAEATEESIRQTHRADRFAGFSFGLLKGAVLVAFLTFGLRSVVIDRLDGYTWVREASENSRALTLDRDYQPASRIWNWQPVQTLIAQVQTRDVGLPDPNDDPESSQSPNDSRLAGQDTTDDDFDPMIDQLDRIGRKIEMLRE